MPVLENGTLPATTGTAELTGVLSVGPAVRIATANSLIQTGVFDYSNTRPVFLPVTTSTPRVSVATATSVTQTGIIVLATSRPALTGFSSISLGQSGSGPAVTPPATAPATRQILIR